MSIKDRETGRIIFKKRRVLVVSFLHWVWLNLGSLPRAVFGSRHLRSHHLSEVREKNLNIGGLYDFLSSTHLRTESVVQTL